MKLLFDQNLSFKLCRQLADLFLESTQIRLVQLDRSDDRTVWDFAKANDYTLVTLDADLAEMAILFGPPPHVIWLRCGNQPTDAIEQLLREHGEVINALESSSAACLELY
jgi:predicted nuclease of predicted toxin-antitoxin system